MIRRLVASDVEAYVAIRREALEREPFAFGSSPGEGVAHSIGEARTMLDDRQQAVFGAFDFDLAGIVGVRRQSRRKLRHKAELWGMYVRADRRGRGFALRLMEAAIAFTRELDGVRWVHLAVTEKAEIAAALYEKLGFVVWGIEPAALCIDGVDVSEKHMVLRL